MPARGADIEVVTPDWSIAFDPNTSPVQPTQMSSHDMQVSRVFNGPTAVIGAYNLLLGSGGIDDDHQEISVVVNNGAVAVSTSMEFVDNTHRILWITQFGVGPIRVPVDPIRVNIAIRRLQPGGEP
jgi:hypothetical protein